MIIGEAQKLKERARSLIKSLDDHRFIDERIAVGISVKKEGNYGLALRIQSATRNRELEKRLRRELRGLGSPDDIDLRYTGPVVPIPLAKLRKRTDVLRIGSSIAHADTPAAGGTLGFFAKCRLTGVEGFVSNNHVIGLLNNASVDSDIVRPDGEVVGDFVRSVPLDNTIENHVDASFARLTTTNVERSSLPGGATLQSAIAAPGESIKVKKFGAKSKSSSGEVTSFDYEHFTMFGYSAALAVVEFDHQIEIKPSNLFDFFPFADDGDSGSLVYNDSHRAVGLLFGVAGSLAYANPMQFVLDELKVDLMT